MDAWGGLLHRRGARQRGGVAWLMRATPWPTALRARMLLIHASNGDLDAFNRHVADMLARGATRAEQLMLGGIMAGLEPTSRIVIATTTRVGRPRGAERTFETSTGSVTKDMVGEAIFNRLGRNLYPDRAELTSAYDWAVKAYSPMDRRLLRKIWQSHCHRRLANRGRGNAPRIWWPGSTVPKAARRNRCSALIHILNRTAWKYPPI